jgi:hypothetical protein
MADEKARSQNQENDKDKGKAMGATAGYQGQSLGPNPQGETAGQGGGVQGTGQRQPNPGGYTEGDGGPRDQSGDRRGNEASTQERHEPGNQ